MKFYPNLSINENAGKILFKISQYRFLLDVEEFKFSINTEIRIEYDLLITSVMEETFEQVMK